jgi:dTDP-4-amino-4,6-dideoxygalactose transaminase
MIKPISISLSPNTEPDDIRLAFKLILHPAKWKKGDAINKLENEFKKYFNVKYAFAFNSGRSSLLAILNSLVIKPESEVLLQAFTCNAAANPVLWTGLKPVYIDCNENDFNIDIKDLSKKITGNSRVLMVQHTFGMPADMEEVLKIAREKNLILIEDCAHSLGAEYDGKKVGTFSKAAFFSFSRDKIISSVYGGVVITNDDDLAKRIGEFSKNLKCPSYYWIFQQLLHPVLLNWLILPIYGFIDIGKIFLVASQWLHILSKAVHWKEKRGKMPSYFPGKLPNGLAVLALNQFPKIDRFNRHRKDMADYYYKELKDSSFILPKEFEKRKNVFLRFTVKHPDAISIIYRSWKKENILIGDWYTSPIAPADTKIEKMGYKMGDCPNAERLSNITFNLPTHINISIKDAERVVGFLKKNQ